MSQTAQLHITPGGPDEDGADDANGDLESAFLRASRDMQAKKREREDLAAALRASKQQFEHEAKHRKAHSDFRASPSEHIRRVSSRDFLRGRVQPSSSTSNLAAAPPVDPDLAFLGSDSEDSLLEMHHGPGDGPPLVSAAPCSCSYVVAVLVFCVRYRVAAV